MTVLGGQNSEVKPLLCQLEKGFFLIYIFSCPISVFLTRNRFPSLVSPLPLREILLLWSEAPGRLILILDRFPQIFLPSSDHLLDLYTRF